MKKKRKPKKPELITTTFIFSKTEFEEKNGKLYHKVLKKIETPRWFERCEELALAGFNDHEIAVILNSEGFTASYGGKINTDTIRCKRSNMKKARNR